MPNFHRRGFAFRARFQNLRTLLQLRPGLPRDGKCRVLRLVCLIKDPVVRRIGREYRVIGGGRRSPLHVVPQDALPSARCCTSARENVAVNPFIAVQVNGGEALVNWGSSLGRALAKAGSVPDTVLSTLTVSRPYKGGTVPMEIDRENKAILGLTLAGGKAISFGR